MRKRTIILLVSLAMLIPSQVSLAKKETPPNARDFEVKYDGGPYEKVMAADQYRNELMKTESEERAFKDIYFERAKELYEKALLEDEMFIYGCLSYGFLNLWASTDAYLSKNKTLVKEAREKFNRAISLNRFCYDCYYYLAFLDTLEKDWDAALANLREYIRSENDDSYYHLLLGYIYASERGRPPQKADDEFELAKEEGTDPISVKWAIGQLKGKQKPRGVPPIRIPIPPRKEYFPKSVSMNIYVRDFVDKTGHEEIQKLRELLSSRIGEAIFRNNRFTLIEKSASQQEESANSLAFDSVLVGSLINADLMAKTLVCSIKVIYPQGGNILFSRQFEVPYRDKPMLAIADRDINRIVGEIEKNFIKSEGTVIQVSRDHVTVNLGTDHGIRPGYRGLVLEKASQIVLPRTRERITTEIYLGEILFEQIEEKVSKARILNPGRVTIEVGDLVRTK